MLESASKRDALVVHDDNADDALRQDGNQGSAGGQRDRECSRTRAASLTLCPCIRASVDSMSDCGERPGRASGPVRSSGCIRAHAHHFRALLSLLRVYGGCAEQGAFTEELGFGAGLWSCWDCGDCDAVAPRRATPPRRAPAQELAHPTSLPHHSP